MKVSTFILFFLLVIFLDSMAIGLTFTIVPPLLLKTDPHAFLPDHIPLVTRGFLLGVIIILFTAGQFLCSPLLGYLSAVKGHKNTLLILLFLSVIAYLIGTASLWIKSVLLLFVFKFIVGISTSGRPVFQTALTQQMPEGKKALLYGWLGASGGLGFIAGSFLTQLGIETFPMIPRYMTFFVIATALSLMNCVLISRTLQHLPILAPQERWSLQKGFIELKGLIRQPALKPVFLLFLFYFIAWELFYTFIPIFLMKHLDLSTEQTTVFYTASNFWNLIGNGVLEHWTSRFSNRKVLMIFAPIWSLTLFIVGFIKTPSLFWIDIALISSLGAVLNCTLSAFLADQVETRHEGDALGLSQALQCIARLLPSFALATVLIHYPSIPLQASALAFLVIAYLGWKATTYHPIKS